MLTGVPGKCTADGARHLLRGYDALVQGNQLRWNTVLPCAGAEADRLDGTVALDAQIRRVLVVRDPAGA